MCDAAKAGTLPALAARVSKLKVPIPPRRSATTAPWIDAKREMLDQSCAQQLAAAMQAAHTASCARPAHNHNAVTAATRDAAAATRDAAAAARDAAAVFHDDTRIPYSHGERAFGLHSADALHALHDLHGAAPHGTAADGGRARVPVGARGLAQHVDRGLAEHVDRGRSRGESGFSRGESGLARQRDSVSDRQRDDAALLNGHTTCRGCGENRPLRMFAAGLYRDCDACALASLPQQSRSHAAAPAAPATMRAVPGAPAAHAVPGHARGSGTTSLTAADRKRPRSDDAAQGGPCALKVRTRLDSCCCVAFFSFFCG